MNIKSILRNIRFLALLIGNMMMYNPQNEMFSHFGTKR